MNWRRRRDPLMPASAEELLAERLSAYLDGEDTPAERAALEAELASDAAAREALDGLRRVQETLAALGSVRAPRSFALAAAPASAGTNLPSFAWVTRAGAAVSALLLAVVLTQGRASETPVTSLQSAKESAPVAAETQGPADAAGILSAPAGEPAPSADSTPPAPPPVASPEPGALLAPAPAAAPAAAPASEPTSTLPAPAAAPSAAATPTPGGGERSVAPAVAPPLPAGAPEAAGSPAGAQPAPDALPDSIGGGIDGGTIPGEPASYNWNGAAAGLAVATVLLGLLALLPLGSRRGGR